MICDLGRIYVISGLVEANATTNDEVLGLNYSSDKVFFCRFVVVVKNNIIINWQL